MATLTHPPVAFTGRQGSNNFNVAELAQTLFEEAGDALFLFDPESEMMVDVNPMAERLCGFTSAELLTMKVTYLFRSEAKGGMNLLRQAFMKTGFFHSQEGFLMRHQKDGVWVPVNLTVSRLHTRPKLLAMITARDIRERREAEKQLEKTEALLRRVIVSVSDCVWEAEMDSEGRWTKKYMSPVIERITGRSAEHYTGLDAWLGTIHTEDRSRGRECIARLSSGATNYEELEYRIYWPDGTLRWLRDKINVAYDSARNVRTFHGIVSDITARKQAEEALREQQILLHNILHHIPMSIFWKDRNSVYMGCNAQNARDLGAARPEDLIGKCDLDMGFAPGEAEFYRECDRKVMDSGHPLLNIEETQLRPDGTEAVLLTSKVPLRDSKDQVMGILGIYADITERKRTEELLRQSQERLENLVNSIDGIVWEGDWATRKLTFVSKQVERILGHTAESLCAEDNAFFLGHVHPEDRASVLSALAGVARGGGNQSLEYRIIAADGSIKWLRDVVTVVAEENRPVRLRGIVVDRTESKLLEEQFRQAQKMEAVGRLAGGVAHDFNNLLTIISGYTDLMRAKNMPAEACQSLLAEVQTASERAAGLTRQLLTFSRKQLLAPRVIDLNRLVIDIEKMLRRLIGEDIKLQTTLPADLGRVRADSGQIEQILLNLAINARDAMPSGGSLRLRTFNVEVDPAMASHAEIEPGSYVALEVSDTGCGMTDEVKAHIFEPFFTTKEVGKGTGLGLATVYGIVKQSQGHISVSSRPDEGTTFTILLPRVENVPVSPPPEDAKEPPPRGWETVLLAEDEDAVRALARIVLQGAGYKVLEANDGVRAVELSRTHKGPIHLLLTDVIMPRMSGPQAAEVLAKEREEMKVLYFSGYTNDAIAEHGVLNESVAFLQKPVTPEALARKVRAVLDGKHTIVETAITPV